MITTYEDNQRSQEHKEKYEAKAQWLGVQNLKNLLLTESVSYEYKFRKFGPITKENVKAAIERGDEHLNTIALVRWDARHDAVVALVRKALKGGTIKTTSWSQCDSVCTLKHVAKYHL